MAKIPMTRFIIRNKFSCSMKGLYLVGYIKTKEKRLLESASFIKKAVTRICKIINLKVVGEKYHIFKSPNGITYCFFLSQSHFVVHTWPEENKIFFDIFTCNKELNEEKIIDVLSKEFKGIVKDIRKIEHK